MAEAHGGAKHAVLKDEYNALWVSVLYLGMKVEYGDGIARG